MPLIVAASLALGGVVAVPVALSAPGNGNAKGLAHNKNAAALFDLVMDDSVGSDRGASTNNGAHKDQGEDHGDCKNDRPSNPHQQNMGNHFGYDCKEEDDDDECEEGKPEETVSAAHDDAEECPKDPDPVIVTPPGNTTVNNTTINNTTINNAAPAAQANTAASVRAPRVCLSRRSFRIRIRTRKADPVRRATVSVNGRKVQVVKGRRLTAPVRLVGLGKGETIVNITARTKSGRTLRGTRTYHPCTPKRASTIPNL